MLDWLKVYEDTGLEPDEIMRLCGLAERAKTADLLLLDEYQALGPIDHLRELAQAEKSGRLVVHGRWLKNTRFNQKRRKCSECGFDSDFKFNFCPYCGAQMDLTEEDSHV